MTVNKFEVMKAEKDGLDVWPDLLRYAAEDTPVDQIPEDDLQRMKWYGIFHRPQTPGTFMMRLRLPGGRATSAQLRVIAGFAAAGPHPYLDLTSRQNIQLRGFRLPDVPGMIGTLRGAGVLAQQTGLDNVRNVMGCPIAGLDGEEVLDATDVVEALVDPYLGNRAYSNLPRKFNVSVTGCRQDCGHAQTQDLGFIPATRDGVAGFNVLVGGALGGTAPRLATPLDVFVEPHEVQALFLALLRVYRDHGPRERRTQARLKWLIEEWGEARLREAVVAELGQPLRPAGTDERSTVAGDHLGVHSQRQTGFSYVGLHVAVGHISADQLIEVSRLADVYGAGEVRLTLDQNVLIPHVPDASLPALLAEPLLKELRPEVPAIWRSLVACTGNDFCHYSLIDTKGTAVRVATELERRGVEAVPGTRIHISGCVHACAKHHIADIGIQGVNVRLDGKVEEAGDVFTGGRLGEDGRLAKRTQEKVLLTDLADAIEGLLTASSTATTNATTPALTG
jgi:ferredoxin-nitrite reductase